MLECPKCGDSVQVNLPEDSRINDMADLSRQNRRGGNFGVIKCGGCNYEGDPLEFDPRSLLPKVKRCIISTNGMVMAFDAAGEQMCDCQGFLLVVAPELKVRCDEHTQWQFGRWKHWVEDADFAWWFIE